MAKTTAKVSAKKAAPKKVAAKKANVQKLVLNKPAILVVDMLNDFYLGLSVVALGLIIWLVILLVKDPKGVVKAALFKKK